VWRAPLARLASVDGLTRLFHRPPDGQAYPHDRRRNAGLAPADIEVDLGSERESVRESVLG